MPNPTRSWPLLALLLLLLALPETRAQAPAWQTAIAPTGSVIVSQVAAADAGGNVYLVGTFYGTVSFGSTTLVSAGGHDAFVAKWSAGSNAFAWAVQLGGRQRGTDAVAIAVSGANVYVAGGFSGADLAVGSTTLLNADNSGNSSDIFVARLLDSGTGASFAWAVRTGGTGNESANSLAVNGTSVYLAGTILGAASTIGSTTLTSAGGYDGFVAKLTDTGAGGTFVWARQMGGSGGDEARQVRVNGNSVYVAGYFRFFAYCGTIPLAGAGNFDGFVTKLTDAGSTADFVWAQPVGGSGDDDITALAVSGTNVYVGGSFAGYYGSTTARFGTITLTSAGNTDAFAAKLLDAGASSTWVWAQRAGGTDFDYTTALAVSGGSVYLTGTAIGPADFGPITLGVASGSGRIFVAQLTDNGVGSSYAWAVRGGADADDIAGPLAISGSRLYVAGHVRPPATFGSQVIGAANGTFVTFLASLAPATLATTAARPAFELGLFPNPAHTMATVRLPALPGNATAQLRLLDALGRVVRSQRVPLLGNGTSADVSLLGLGSGCYYLQVQVGEQQAGRMLVVE